MSDLNALKKRLQIGTATNQFGINPINPLKKLGITGKQITITVPSLSIGSFDGPTNWTSILYKVLIVLLILLTVAIFIHFTIKPIFRFSTSPDAPIPLPFGFGGVKGDLYWNIEEPYTIVESTGQTHMHPNAYDYTMTMDILVVDPNLSVLKPDLSGNDRLIFCRSNVSSITNFNKSDTGLYNLAIYMEAANNDIIVATTTSKGTTSYINNVVVRDVPYGKPFRLGVVLSEHYMEVYVNSKLHKTKTLTGQPKGSIGYYIPSPHENIFKMKNFQVWSRILAPKEIRAIEPQLSGFEGIDILRTISENGSCGLLTNTIEDAVSGAEDSVNIVDELGNDAIKGW
jgi:hypothetical protein